MEITSWVISGNIFFRLSAMFILCWNKDDILHQISPLVSGIHFTGNVSIQKTYTIPGELPFTVIALTHFHNPFPAIQHINMQSSACFIDNPKTTGPVVSLCPYRGHSRGHAGANHSPPLSKFLWRSVQLISHDTTGCMFLWNISTGIPPLATNGRQLVKWRGWPSVSFTSRQWGDIGLSGGRTQGSTPIWNIYANHGKCTLLPLVNFLSTCGCVTLKEGQSFPWYLPHHTIPCLGEWLLGSLLFQPVVLSSETM